MGNIVLQCDIVARSLNNCTVCVAELYVAVSYVKTPSVAQQCYHGKFMSPVKINRTRVLMSSTQSCIEMKERPLADGIR
jgi:hypothetical protein